MVSSVLVLGFVVGMSGAHAADWMAKNSACKSDIQKYCSDAQAGTPAMGKCMKDNMDQFSDTCKTQMKTAHNDMKKMRENMKSACKSDVQKLCSDVKVGGGNIMKCLNDNESQLSTSCKTARDEMHSKFMAKHAAGQASPSDNSKSDNSMNDSSMNHNQ